jgi:hypothetical protein
MAAPLPRSIPDADCSVSYEFAMDRLTIGKINGEARGVSSARRLL